MSDAAAASRENGKLGGRPKSAATISTQIMRAKLCEKLEQHADELFSALLAKALEGDVPAARELMDRAWGKPQQSVVSEDGEGNVVPFKFDIVFKKEQSE